MALHEGSPVTEVQAGQLRTGDGAWHQFDEALWCTQAAAAGWLRDTGLPVGACPDARNQREACAALQQITGPDLCVGAARWSQLWSGQVEGCILRQPTGVTLYLLLLLLVVCRCVRLPADQ